jgi:succinate dehydrogenase/fumarate reductase cytochrome b subunit
MSAELWLRVQSGTALAFSAFLAPHILNTAYAATGATAYDDLQRALRRVYQHPVFETLLLASLVGHLASGYLKNRAERNRYGRVPSRTGPSWKKRMHTWTGYFLGVFVWAHVFQTRLQAFKPEFAGLAAMATTEVPFVPFMTVALFCGVFHMAVGFPVALRGVLGKKSAVWSFKTSLLLAAVGFGAGLVGLAAMAGKLYPLPANIQDHPWAKLQKGTQ